jgi:hypothetical protein
MKPTPDTQTPEPATAEATTTKAADSRADLTKTDAKTDTKADVKADTTVDTKTDAKTVTEADTKAVPGAGGEAVAPVAESVAAPATTDAGSRATEPDNEIDLDEDDAEEPDSAAAVASSGLGSAAAAVVAVCLGIVALTGTWTGKVLAERQGLVGQLETGQTATAEQQISAIYGDAWHVTAAINGGVALVALLIGAIVLALPQRTAWVRPVAVAGAVLGFLGLLLSVGMYFDLFVAMPTAGS